MERHGLEFTTGVLAVYVFIGGVLALMDTGSDWYHDSVDLASIIMLVPLVALIRQRAVATQTDRNDEPS